MKLTAPVMLLIPFQLGNPGSAQGRCSLEIWQLPYVETAFSAAAAAVVAVTAAKTAVAVAAA